MKSLQECDVKAAAAFENAKAQARQQVGVSGTMGDMLAAPLGFAKGIAAGSVAYIDCASSALPDIGATPNFSKSRER